MGERLTKNDVLKIEKEIENRKLVIRPEAIAAVKEARAQGDLSENFEYYAAKRDKNKNESRIKYLERMLKMAEIIDDESKDDEVGLNKEVLVRFENNQKENRFRIVTSIRGDSLKGNISIESPVGKALMGHKVGERVNIVVNPSMNYDVTILEIKPVDDSEDTIRRY